METAAPARTRAGHIPGEAGLWVLILGDLLAFSLFFAVFLVHRAQHVALFAASQAAMGRGFGLANTALLLTSSLFVAWAVVAARAGAPAGSARLIILALSCGCGFIGSKVLEWGGKIAAGITLNTNEFYGFYYMFTGIHLLHVLLGMGVLVYLLARSNRADRGASYVAVMEGGGVFWHLVDLLWVILFALFYLLR
jgi:nitric oxide reductase NorE protein